MHTFRLYVFLVLLGIQLNANGQIIKIEETNNYDSISLKKLSQAVLLLDSILITDDFRIRVLNAKFVGTKGKSNQEIYDNLMSGNSKFDSSHDKTINLYLAVYAKYGGRNELGFTSGKKTSTHRCFIHKNNVGCLAGHLIHEYMHVMGFSHNRISSEKPKSKTVPYVIGNIVKTMLSAASCPAVKKNCY